MPVHLASALARSVAVAIASVLAGCASPEPAFATVAVAEPAPVPTTRAPRARTDAPSDVVLANDRSAPEPVAPPPPLDPFPDREDVSVEELFAAIDRLADEIADAPDVRRDFLELVEAKGLLDSPELYRDYVRVKLAFEATRDAGLWHLHWDITNEQPNSDRIWSQWKGAAVPDADAPRATAIAECDELSALFAFVARGLGVHGIGLFWPTWNHVVAVWTVPGVQTETGSPVRILVPTSQIFLTQDDTLGTEGFNAWKQKTIYEYRRRDVKPEHRIDADLARFFVRQIAEHGRASQAELQRARNERDARLSAG
jgi:hypothetical protein